MQSIFITDAGSGMGRDGRVGAVDRNEDGYSTIPHLTQTLGSPMFSTSSSSGTYDWYVPRGIRPH